MDGVAKHKNERLVTKFFLSAISRDTATISITSSIRIDKTYSDDETAGSIHSHIYGQVGHKISKVFIF